MRESYRPSVGEAFDVIVDLLRRKKSKKQSCRVFINLSKYKSLCFQFLFDRCTVSWAIVIAMETA